MPRYCTVDQLTLRFGERELLLLTDREQTGNIVHAVAEAAIDLASAEIDSWSGVRLQAAGITTIVMQQYCADMARYHLYDDQPTDTVKQRYENAIRFFKAVGEGKVGLGLDDAGNAPQAAGGAQVVSGGRIWDRQSSQEFI